MSSSPESPRTYLDSNVFILAIAYKGRKPDAAKDLLLKMVRGELRGVTSSLTVDEVVWSVLKNTGKRDVAIEQGERLFKLANLLIVSVDAQSVLRGLSLMRAHRELKPRDAIHAGVCMNKGISIIHSDDPDFDSIPGLRRIGLTAG